MRLMLLSQNSLFREVLSKALEDCRELEIISPAIPEAANQVLTSAPQIIVLDETLPADQIELLIKNARSLETCKVLLVNPNQNDLVTLSSHRSSMRNANDLLKAIFTDSKQD